MMNDEERLERRFAAMIRRDGKAYARMAALRDAAENMIGEIMIDGHLTSYINLRPLHRGKIKTGDRNALIDFLIRNQY